MADSIRDTSTEWILDSGEATELRIDGVLADGIGGRRRGGSYDVVLVFRDAVRDGGDRPAVECFNELLDRGAFGGSFELHELADGQVAYTPTWPGHAEPLLVHLMPVDHRSVPIPGLWGLLEAAEAETMPTTGRAGDTNVAAVALSITYLADSEAYADREALQADLEHPGLL